MGFGTSLFLLAAGAVLTFAVEVDQTDNFNINTLGIILMVAGAIGMIASMFFWNSWGGFHRRRYVEEDMGQSVGVPDGPYSRR